MDVVTGDFVPTLNFINVKADAVVKAKIGTTPDMPAAAQNFLGWGTEDISEFVRDVLEGNLCEMIGKIDLRVMVNNRRCNVSRHVSTMSRHITIVAYGPHRVIS